MEINLTEAFINDIIKMAWADDVSFEKIKKQRGLSEPEVLNYGASV
jgi:uncharacterized protein (TIGR03643 family)